MPIIESAEVLEKELRKIEKWEKSQKGLWFWEKIGRIPFALLDKITPKFIQDKIGVVIDELGSYIQTGGQYLISERMIFKKFNPENVTNLEEVRRLPLEKMDHVAEEIRNSREKAAAIQGATTGIGGIFTLVIDIPVLLGLSLKVLQEIALSYGFDPKEKSERVFIVKCLQFTSSDVVGKKAILEELTDFNAEKRSGRIISQLQGWREVVATYRDHFGWKKLFQLVPIAGIVFGAMINRSSIQDVAETGIMLYRKRRILERLHEKEELGELL
ncbi:EcsC family protein [Neobacillus mesonae]|uniref:EcsC family protein n=1 Tax=Neobacillus mesonae TaxID=1193713 RepID=UPI00203F03E7|nr:EcsC family protein [Neobacillus mesonae]MCM3570850.1 EcsC family protein [Neobacillus mesonae]